MIDILDTRLIGGWEDDGGRVAPEPAPLDLSALSVDHATLVLPDGRTLRLRIEADDIDPFAEFDTYGKVAPAVRSADYRPAGFDGDAEKLSTATGRVWWQPPADGPRRSETSAFAGLRALVIDLLDDGMSGVTLEVLDGQDAYGRPIVRDVASLWAIDSLANDYLGEVVCQLAAELGLTS